MSEQKPLVVRFAPSPTGSLHVGGARTALFNYLYARGRGGKFLLRIEDTDRERSTAQAVEAIFEGLRWLGLEWDGEPLYQSRGLDRHLDAARRLLESGAAYRCFCTPEVLEEKRSLARENKRDFLYDRTCLALDRAASAERARKGEPHVVRFLIPDGCTGFEDAVHGTVRFDNCQLEDFVIVRSDGSPTYQLAVVADDIYMGITRIIRGDDHISNTPKQVLLYRAMGAEEPGFAHVPLILGPDKKRLSKRHGAASLIEYRNKGFLSPAVFNFLALLGWSPGDDREILSRDELTELFTLEGISKRNAVFDLDKLEWMNGQYLSAMAPEAILDLAAGCFVESGLIKPDLSEEERRYLLRVLGLVKHRCRLLGEFPPRSRYFFPGRIEYEPGAMAKHWKSGTAEQMASLYQALEKIEDWKEEALESALRRLAEKLQVSAGKLIHPLRVALTGMSVSPGIFEVMAVMGRSLVLERIREAVSRFESTGGD